MHAGGILLLFTVRLLCVTAVAADSDSSSARPPFWKNGTYHLTLDGRDRTFMLDVPSKLKPEAPLVMVFHGFTNSARDVRDLTGLAKVSEQHGFVAVYPQGTRDSKGKSFFNVGYEFHRDQSVDDVQIIRSLAARLTRDLRLDARSVFATGFSNGGDMSFLLGAQRESFVAAIALGRNDDAILGQGFQNGSRISVLAVNTRDDKTTLWNGDMNNRDGWGAYLSTEAVMDLWVKGLSLEHSERKNPGKTIQLRLWSTGPIRRRRDSTPWKGRAKLAAHTGRRIADHRGNHLAFLCSPSTQATPAGLNVCEPDFGKSIRKYLLTLENQVPSSLRKKLISYATGNMIEPTVRAGMDRMVPAAWREKGWPPRPLSPGGAI